MKKGRHRRFEEARNLKQSRTTMPCDLLASETPEPSPGMPYPMTINASWCLVGKESDADDADW